VLDFMPQECGDTHCLVDSNNLGGPMAGAPSFRTAVLAPYGKDGLI